MRQLLVRMYLLVSILSPDLAFALIKVKTGPDLEYQFFPFNPDTWNTLRFKVKASNNVQIMFSGVADPSASDPVVEVILGGWNNTQSGIKRDRMFPFKKLINTPKLLNKDEFRSFWVSPAGSRHPLGPVVSAALGTEQHPFLEWMDPNSFEVNFFGVATNYGSSGEWEIEGCTENAHCPELEACVRNQCESPCNGYQACGHNAICVVEQHQFRCECKPGYIPVDPTHSSSPHDGEKCMAEPTCVNDSECGANESCKEGKCVKDVCKENCGPNTQCTETGNNVTCVCKPGFTGDPTDNQLGCHLKPHCTWDYECSEGKTCLHGLCVLETRTVEQRCEEKCGPNTSCDQDSEVGAVIFCRCKTGLAGYPYDKVLGCGKKCSSNDDCPGNQACHSNICADTCNIGTPCGSHSVCTIQNHSVKCECLPDYIYSYPTMPEFGCKMRECLKASDCSKDRACVEGRCQAKSKDCKDNCGPHTYCTTWMSIIFCSCMKGYTGDPYDKEVGCKAEPTPECETDADCTTGATCTAGYCVEGPRIHEDPCKGKCGPDTTCTVTSNNETVCSCKAGFVGDPYDTRRGCFKSDRECSVDTDCRPGSICKEGKCVVAPRPQDPCVDKCGPNAYCTVTADNTALCMCNPGYTGSPYDKTVGCSKVPEQECSMDSECRPGTICKEGVCVEDSRTQDPCVDKCGPNTYCTVTSDITAICTCNTGYIGFPYDRIKGCVRKVEEECTMDSQCRPGAICKEGKCVDIPSPQDPCANTCGPNTYCTVTSTNTAICMCYPGYIGSPYDRVRGCYRDIQQECSTDAQCIQGTICVEGKCVEGERTQNNTNCHPGNQFCFSGCFDSDWCCFNSEPPGKQDPCCSSNLHCDPKNITAGDPKTYCRFRVCECRQDSECSEDQYCERGRCILWPRCQASCDRCGKGAECNIYRNIALCSCKAYHSGDPYDKELGCSPVAGPCFNESGRMVTSSPNCQKHYVINKRPVTWYEGFRNCLAMNMRLASVRTKWEQTALEQTIKDDSINGIRTDLWLGAIALHKDREYQWIGAGLHDMSYSSWNSTAPSGVRGKDCVVIGVDMSWHDSYCSSKTGYVCEYIGKKRNEQEETMETSSIRTSSSDTSFTETSSKKNVIVTTDEIFIP